MNTKICTKCNKELPATKDNFNAQKDGKFGLRSVCKPCIKIYRKQYTSTDEYKKAHRERQAKWRKENPEKTLEISRKNYKIHRHKHNAKKRERLKNDSEFRAKVHEIAKKYRDSGRRYEMNSKPENREKARLRSAKRRLIPEKKEHDCSRNEQWRKENKELINSLTKKKIEELEPSYIAGCMRISVKDLTPEVYETKKLIVQLKRELKNNNVKIR